MAQGVGPEFKPQYHKGKKSHLRSSESAEILLFAGLKNPSQSGLSKKEKLLVHN
jgi:hypothetical protein